MKKSFISTFVIMSIGILTLLCLCKSVWAGGGGAVQPGGNGNTGGPVDDGCDGSYSGIYPESCGPDGGGRNWRAYKVASTINKLNEGATWKVIEAPENKSEPITGNGILSDCVADNAPYIIIMGLNKVNSDHDFEVSYKISGNKGSRYELNDYFDDAKRSISAHD